MEELFRDGEDATTGEGGMTMENSAPPAPGGGVIHDIGYRHYTGPRLGRPGIVRALVWHSLRSSVRHRPGRQGQDHPGHRVRG